MSTHYTQSVAQSNSQVQTCLICTATLGCRSDHHSYLTGEDTGTGRRGHEPKDTQGVGGKPDLSRGSLALEVGCIPPRFLSLSSSSAKLMKGGGQAF